MKNLIYKRKILTNAKNSIKEFAVELFKFTFNKKNFASYFFNMHKRNSKLWICTDKSWANFYSLDTSQVYFFSFLTDFSKTGPSLLSLSYFT